MTTILVPQDKAHNKISYYLIALFLISLPFDRFYSQLAVVCLLIHSVMFASVPVLNKQTIKNLLVVTSVYLFTIICTIYSTDKSTAFDEWEKQLAIVLFPLIFILNPIDLSFYKRHLLILFSISCALAIVYLYFVSFEIINYNKLPARAIFSKAFINHNFSSPIGTHATYLSMYIMLSLVFCIDEVINAAKPRINLLFIPIIIILSLGLFQLSSKSVLISGFFLITIFFPLFRLSGKRRTYFFLSALVLSVLAMFLIIKIDSINQRFLVDLKNDLVLSSEKNESLEPRVVRWKHVLLLIKESPVFGHGTGSERKLLSEEYFKHGLYNSFLNNLNAHNQYLSLWLKTGIAGLLVYLYVLFIGFRQARLQKDIVFFAFILQVATVSVIENLLDVNKGIFLYAFFLPLFIFTNNKLNLKERHR